MHDCSRPGEVNTILEGAIINSPSIKHHTETTGYSYLNRVHIEASVGTSATELSAATDMASSLSVTATTLFLSSTHHLASMLAHLTLLLVMQEHPVVPSHLSLF